MLITQCLATAVFLIPLLTLWSRRFGRSTTPWELTLDIPFSIALDALSVLVVARFCSLEIAILTSRVVWLGVFIAIVLRRWHSIAWPFCLNGRMVAAVIAASGLVMALGLGISRNYTVWDRPWHAPLVSSLGGQSLPFVNVYGAGNALHYHLAGDLIAVLLRAASLSTISSNLALSLAHDVLFGLTAMTIGLLMIGFGVRRAFPVVFGAAALLLHGPIPMRQGVGQPFQGYSYPLFFSVSYRPHVPVATLMLVGFLGALAVRAIVPQSVSPRRLVPVLIATTALLAISDEATLALIGLGLGGMWLVYPRMLAKTRIRGIGVLVAIAAAALIPNLLFNGSIAPGGPIQRISWLSQAMVPSVEGDVPLPLASIKGSSIFLLDSLPYLSCWFGLAAAAFWMPLRSLRPLVVLGGIVIVASAVLGLHLRVNGADNESQRFFVAPFFATLCWGVLLLHRIPSRSFAGVAVFLGLAVPPFFSLYWISQISPEYMESYRETEMNPWAKETTYGLDCRKIAGAHIGDRPKPTYVDMYHHYVFASCRPIFGPGRTQPPWTTQTLPQFESRNQLRGLAAMVGNKNVDAICASAPGSRRDSVCAYALEHRRDHCTQEGTRFLRCSLTVSDRNAILRRWH